MTVCRSCGHAELMPVLDLGRSPLANALLLEEDLVTPEPVFPLELVYCPHCTLAQITETVPAEQLFGEYLYFSSHSDAMLTHARQTAEKLIVSRNLGPGSLVMEIGSNDGYLLQHFAKAGVPVLGIEPAQNIAREAVAKGFRTLNAFFTAALAETLPKADVVIGNNVIAHVADLNGLIRGVATVLKDEGVGQFEVAYVRDMIERCAFDQIYHEHLCYYSLTALTHLFARHGLRVVDVELIPMQGQSLQVRVARQGVPSRAVEQLLREELAWGVEFYQGFAQRVEQLRPKLLAVLNGFTSVAGYGAAAKATTLLNYFGLGRDRVSFVVDRSPHKQGRYIPGVRVPIVGPEQLLLRMPEATLLLAWNLAREVMVQQAEYRRQGGRFVIPIPEPTAV